MLHRWFCEACGVKGTAQIPAHAGVWEGMGTVMDAHIAKSPTCVGIVRMVVDVNTATKRRKRRTAKQALKHGVAAKRKHARIAGRTGAIKHKRMKGLLAETRRRKAAD